MSRKSLPLIIGVVGGSAIFVLQLVAQRSRVPPAVQISVQASDPSSGRLHYQWKSTDGTIQNVDAATTTWVLPKGRGIHFAYVLVSNGLGGYTEQHVAVNTDSIGEPVRSNNGRNGRLRVPPSAAPVRDVYRGRIKAFAPDAEGNPVLIPNVSVSVQDPNSGFQSESVLTDRNGEYRIPGITPSPGMIVSCRVGGVSVDCTPDHVKTGAPAPHVPLSSLVGVSGRFTLADLQTPCGVSNEFFGVHAHATATLLDSANHVLATAPVDERGSYFFLPNSAGATVLLACEGARPVTVSFEGGRRSSLPSRATAAKAPIVANMTATLQGTLIATAFDASSTALTALPSDTVPGGDVFLIAKGIDNPNSTCVYYDAIQAVTGCDANGNFIGPIDYAGWQSQVGIGASATGGVPTVRATFINQYDLDLTRIHQSISYGAGQITAAVVCNHSGTTNTLNPSQLEINTAIAQGAIAGNNLIACVAMDYNFIPGVVRFLIFGPSGQLLASVDLDGRGQKYVPGTCTVCHGADNIFSPFGGIGPQTPLVLPSPLPSADIGAHFLPYDIGNFAFGTKPGFRPCDQEDAIYSLNQNVLNTNPTDAVKNLVTNWYSTRGTLPPLAAAEQQSNTCPANVMHVQNNGFVPPDGWSNYGDVYVNVFAHSCRTCHETQFSFLNFDVFDNVVTELGNIQSHACVFPGYTPPLMPNSLVTFNRLWSPNLSPDQRSSFQNFINQLTPPCMPPN